MSSMWHSLTTHLLLGVPTKLFEVKGRLIIVVSIVLEAVKRFAEKKFTWKVTLYPTNCYAGIILSQSPTIAFAQHRKPKGVFYPPQMSPLIKIHQSFCIYESDCEESFGDFLSFWRGMF
jgi:hypothetical protein